MPSTFGVCLCFLLRRTIFSLYVSKSTLILFIIGRVVIFLIPLIQYFMEACFVVCSAVNRVIQTVFHRKYIKCYISFNIKLANNLFQWSFGQ